jgi:hypothetical protein
MFSSVVSPLSHAAASLLQDALISHHVAITATLIRFPTEITYPGFAMKITTMYTSIWRWTYPRCEFYFFALYRRPPWTENRRIRPIKSELFLTAEEVGQELGGN